LRTTIVIRRSGIKIKIHGYFPEFIRRFIQNIILKRNCSFSGESNTNSSFQDCRLLKCVIKFAAQNEPRQNFE